MIATVHTEDNTIYSREVITITFVEGNLYLVLRDEQGKPYTTSYTADSLKSGHISITE